MAETPSDLEFLRELIAQTDQRSGSENTSASAVLAALGAPEVDPEPVVTRLRSRGLIAVNPSVAPRFGDGWWDALVVTPDGYRHDDTGLNQ